MELKELMTAFAETLGIEGIEVKERPRLYERLSCFAHKSG
jgi:hypothetical protein